MRVLVDPVWDERAAPTQWAGPKRFFPPTLALGDLPAMAVSRVSPYEITLPIMES